ncbi:MULTISPECIES: 5-deoxy-glucuronate isomerase [Micrococcaceae]|uniref:5-deoxy-glucuronate isomerase n=1 Tax=Micrococcaceae TaxID=1268 RepID=UPI001AE5B88D|nr:5-deoxy-glucuronate isomerase [Arthrobacter sp. PvP023]
MTQWVHPSGTAAQGEWSISLGGNDSALSIDGWRYTGLKVAHLTPGEEVSLDPADEERIVIPLAGPFAVTVDDVTYALRGRDSVFSGADRRPLLRCWTPRANFLRQRRPRSGCSRTCRVEYPTRLILAEETPVELRGSGNCSRQVHNFGTPAALEADRFIVCEVLTPAGNWSSYPPHKHDVEKDGETSLEEIYYFETRASAELHSDGAGVPGGVDPVGYARVYASDERHIDVQAEVRTGDVVLVPYGWHGPAMAAPGYDLYYLNVMAGPGRVREWLISDDPHHGWVRNTWDAQEIDPRGPFVA